VEPALAAVAFVPGLAVGSFVGVLAARLPLRRSVVSPGSACMSCASPLAWYDNIPLFSYVALRGRCRRCGTRIPPRDLMVEVLTAMLVALCALVFGLSPYSLLAALFCGVLVAVAATDLEHRIIPNRLVVPAGVGVLVARTVIDPSPEWLLAALGASGFLLAALLVYPKGMGFGDVKLAFLLGAMLGRHVGVAMMAGMLLALVPSLVLLARHGRAARSVKLPFGVFLAAGALLALFVGEPILAAYLDLAR
jgi:leader peptidase (prepilin peptidase) / N-methyltransferase